MAYAAALDEAKALQHWHLGAVEPDTLNQLGSQIESRGLYDVAFVYYRNADALAQIQPGRGRFLAGRLCQKQLVDLAELSAQNQQYCQDYFGSQFHNLLLDGQFEHNISWGWNGEFFFGNSAEATIALRREVGVPPPSLQLAGLAPGRHAGVYQRISMQPGSTVQFRGDFLAEDHGNLEAWLLYIEWRQDGRIHGTHFSIADSDMAWTNLERVFTLPEGSEPWAQFYPALLQGQGIVWSDNVAVVLVRGAD